MYGLFADPPNNTGSFLSEKPYGTTSFLYRINRFNYERITSSLPTAHIAEPSLFLSQYSSFIKTKAQFVKTKP